MAVLRLRLVDEAPEDGQAVQPVHIDGLDGQGGGAAVSDVAVTTLDAGSDATASIDGTTLKLGIPRGDTGAQGPKGDTGSAGAAGAQGTKGDTGEAGPAGLGVSSIALTTDSDGKVTGGTWTDTGSGSHVISVTQAGA